jgi:CBS domain-containing protein
MGLLKIAKSPALMTGPGTTVLDAVRLMMEKKVGAVVIVEDDKLAGVFTERDVMTRIVAAGLDAAKTPVSEVMTRDVVTALRTMTPGAALRALVERHVRHLPVVDEERHVLGMVSLRDLLRLHIDDLSTQLDSVVSYFSADGIGG